MKARYRVDAKTLDECLNGKDGSDEFFRVQSMYLGMKRIDLGYEKNMVLINSSLMSTDATFAGHQVKNLIGFYDAIMRTNRGIDEVANLARSNPSEEVDSLNQIYSMKAAVKCCLASFKRYEEFNGARASDGKYSPVDDFTVSGSRHGFSSNRNSINRMYKQLVASCKDGNQIFEKTYQFFEYLSMALQAQFEQFKDGAPKEFFRNHHICIDGYDVMGISGDAGKEVKLNFGNRDFSHSIGNHEPAEILQMALKYVEGYDPATQTNVFMMDDPKAKPTAILFRGKPGTGKSDLVNITAANMQDIAERKGMKFKLIALNNQKKSKWYAETGAQARAALNEALDPKFLSLIYADDFDMVAASRESTASGADNEYSYEIMNWLDGVMMQGYRGNFILIINTNHSERLDSAIKNRCTYNVEVKGPTISSEYVQQMKLEFGSCIDFVQAGDKEWKDLGNLCENIVSKQGSIQVNGTKKTLKEIIEETTLDPDDFKLSGRDINKICTIATQKIKSSVNPSGFPSNFSELDDSEKLAVARAQYTRIDARILKEIIAQRYEGNIAEKLKEFREREQRIADQYFLEQKGIARGIARLEIRAKGGENGTTKG